MLRVKEMSDFHTSPRLYVSCALNMGNSCELDQNQSHYLANVMRLQLGEPVRIFNGADGEHLATVAKIAKRNVTLDIKQQLRSQNMEPDIWLCCTPIKRLHFDDLVMKACELGVNSIQPILTNRAQVREINVERLRAIAIEAAEQSDRLSIPFIEEPLSLDRMIEIWPIDRIPLICAEFGTAQPIATALSQVAKASSAAIFTGPEGGYQEEELDKLRNLPNAMALRLGARILRANTAAIAALSCWQSICGDWR